MISFKSWREGFQILIQMHYEFFKKVLIIKNFQIYGKLEHLGILIHREYTTEAKSFGTN